MSEVIFYAFLGAALGLAFHDIHKLNKNLKTVRENQDELVKRLDEHNKILKGLDRIRIMNTPMR